MDLTCPVSTLALAVLYRQLADSLNDPELNGVDHRLNTLGQGTYWLTDIAAHYDAAWGNGLTEVQSGVHGLIPSWLLSIGSQVHGSTTFAASLRVGVADAFDRVGETPPDTASLLLKGWTLGRLINHSVSANVAALLLSEPSDPDVMLAYNGLAEHITSLNESAELSCNAVVWRVAALLEALGNGNGLQPGIDLGMRRIDALTTPGRASELKDVLGELKDIRDALTHIRDNQGSGLSFRQACERLADVESAELLLGVATMIVFDHAGDDLAAREVRAVEWAVDAIERDLS